MDEFSASAALALGGVLTVKAYWEEIRAALDRADQAILDLLKAYRYTGRHYEYAGKHRIQAGEEFYRYNKQGKKVIWREAVS